MLITLSQEEGRLPVTVMKLYGDLDSQSYTEVIREAQAAYEAGARRLALDLGKVPFISSAGLMAVHTVALIFGGNAVQAGAGGRPSYRAIDPQKDSAARLCVKLVSPQPRVAQVLDTVGLSQFFETFGDVESAVASF